MPIIEVCDLVKRYAGNPVVNRVSFSVEAGEIFGVLGPNGAGKSTTVECVVGLRRRDGGAVNVLGVDPQRRRDVLRGQVGVQLQGGELPAKLTVGEALRLYSSFYPAPADWRELLDILGLRAQEHTYFRRLSGGQQQRLSIALALIGNPRIAVLDELTTGLDPAGRRATWDLIESVRDRGVTVLLVTHFMAEAEHLCDRIALIDHGRVIAVDTPAGLTAQSGRGPRLSFRPSVEFDERLLTALPEVTGLTRHGHDVVVAGTGNLIAAATSVLARNGIVAEQLRVQPATLDDAFLTLTGHPRNDETDQAAS